jgi:Rab-GTPase-TBC domain
MLENHPSTSVGEPSADDVEDTVSSDNMSQSLHRSLRDRRASIATITDADGDENYTRSMQIREEMRIVSQEHNWYREQLAKDTNIIQDLILSGREKFKFVEDAKTLLGFWDNLSPRTRVCLRVFKDSVKNARISGHNSAHPTIVRSGYSLDLKHNSSSEAPPSKIVLSLVAPSKQYVTLQDKSTSENGQLSTQSASSTSSNGTLIKAFRGQKDFSRMIFNSPNEAGENADLPLNDAEFTENILPLLTVGEPNTSHRETIMQFFRQYTLSDDTRRQLWKLKISNSLGLTSELYECLKIRLKEDGLPRSTTKVINDDLMRMLPDHRNHLAGATMFEAIRELLSLWHIYRPDIGYVQGMSYLMVMLYYYFEDFQCFALFTNMILTREILYNGYNFDLPYVSY